MNLTTHASRRMNVPGPLTCVAAAGVLLLVLTMLDEQPARTFLFQARRADVARKWSVIAKSHVPVTDKVVKGFGRFYDVYFSQDVVAKPVKLLEIGLGCDMSYGPGASSKTWPQLFLQGEIWLAEVNKECVQKYWNPAMRWRYVWGDQGDTATVEGWLATMGGNFDYIIDDGGHTNQQIWNTFQVSAVHILLG
jgi:hypothetical protein